MQPQPLAQIIPFRRNFEVLHGEVCSLLKRAGERLGIDGAGNASFYFAVGGTTVSVNHIANEPGGLTVLVDFGEMDPSREAALCKEALEANFALLNERHGASFARNPVTGSRVLQYAYAFDEADARVLLARIVAMARIADSVTRASRRGVCK